MPNSRSDDSQDVGSSKDSQDGLQMLDSVKIQDLVDRHTASVSVRLDCKLVDKLTNYCHRSGLAVAALRPASAKHKTMAMQRCIVALRLNKAPTRMTCRLPQLPQKYTTAADISRQEDSATSTS